MKYVIIFLLTFSLGFTQNQEAKIFFKDGDSFEGFAMITGNDEIKFRLNLDDKPTKFNSKEIYRIEFYGFEDSVTFEYFKINNSLVLLEIVAEGEVLLLSNTEESWIINPIKEKMNKTKISTLFLKRKSSDEIFSLNNPFLRWKKKMSEYFSDCEELVRKIRTNEFNRSDIKEIVEYYNDYCTDL